MGPETVNSMSMTFQLENFGKYKSTRFKYEKKNNDRNDGFSLETPDLNVKIQFLLCGCLL